MRVSWRINVTLLASIVSITCPFSFTYMMDNFQFNLPDAPKVRTFVGTGFVGSSTTFDSSDIGLFGDGRFIDKEGGITTYDWSDEIIRAAGGGDAAPEREDDRGTFDGDASHTGRLDEVFTVNSLSHIMGTDTYAEWEMDLYFKNDDVLYVTEDTASTDIDLAIIERSGNNYIGIRGIVAGGTKENPNYVGDIKLYMQKNVVASYLGYSINTTESSSSQEVYGTGISLAAFNTDSGNPFAGQELIGFQFYSEGTHNWGPDFQLLVNNDKLVPEPGIIIGVIIGASGLLGFRKK